MQMLNKVILTTTYAGETLSLAAAKATFTVMQNEPVHDHIWKMGARLSEGFNKAAADMGFPYKTYGLPPAVQFHFDDNPERNNAKTTVFFREMFRNGIFRHPSIPDFLFA